MDNKATSTVSLVSAFLLSACAATGDIKGTEQENTLDAKDNNKTELCFDKTSKAPTEFPIPYFTLPVECGNE